MSNADFYRIRRLPPYVFAEVNTMKARARLAGEDIIDLGMGNPDLPTVTWDNPFRPARQGHGQQWHDDEIGVAGCLLSLVNAVRNNSEPTYGAYQARLDQEITLAYRMSSLTGGAPVKLPLDPATQTI